jgi:hypothetical protein
MTSRLNWGHESKKVEELKQQRKKVAELEDQLKIQSCEIEYNEDLVKALFMKEKTSNDELVDAKSLAVQVSWMISTLDQASFASIFKLSVKGLVSFWQSIVGSDSGESWEIEETDCSQSPEEVRAGRRNSTLVQKSWFALRWFYTTRLMERAFQIKVQEPGRRGIGDEEGTYQLGEPS